MGRTNMEENMSINHALEANGNFKGTTYLMSVSKFTISLSSSLVIRNFI